MLQLFCLLICMHMAALSQSVCLCKNEIRNYNICMKSSNSCGLHLSEFEACMKDRFNSMETEMKVLKKAIENIPGTQHVSFMAYASSHIKSTPGNFLKFGTVTINKGNGYDSKTGVFTAPVSGTYSFTLTIAMPAPSSSSDYFRLDVMHINKQAAHLFIGMEGIWLKVSENILLDMKKGEHVRIKVITWPKEYPYIASGPSSYFNGFLIQ